MAQGFADFVDQWTRQSEARMLAVFKRAVELLADELALSRYKGGRLPYDTGNLSRSLLAQIDAMPKIKPEGDDGEGEFAGSDVGAVVATAMLGDAISLGYQANYARRMNYGFVGTDSLGRLYNQTGAGFVEYAASIWPILVGLAAEEIRNTTMA